MTQPKKIGYARTALAGIGFDRQIKQLTKYGCSHIYKEIISGMSDKSPELQTCLESLQKGDTLVVTSLDRLSRSIIRNSEILSELEKKGANLEILGKVPSISLTSLYSANQYPRRTKKE